MKEKSFILVIIAFYVLLIACKSTKPVLTVEKITEVKAYKTNHIFYSLPRTAIAVDVEITKKVYKKGPFSEYASSKLGITKVIEKDYVEWNISGVEFQTIAKFDTTQIYVINSNMANITNFVNLSKEGFLIGFNTKAGTYYSDIEINDNMLINNEDEVSLAYEDITIKKNYKETYDTAYHEVANDTSFVKVPMITTNIVSKSIAEKAHELAEQILVLRDDRNALLVGEGDSQYLPTGDALNIMLDGINTLEAQYLSMFIGKTFTTKQIYHFEYIPIENQKFRQEILFKFSEADGYLPSSSLKGKPVFLEIESEQYMELMNKFYAGQVLYKRTEKVKDKNSGLVYRMPQKAKIKLTHNSKELHSENILIAQYGVNLQLPASLFFNNDYAIEFYPKYGTLKSIEKRKE